MEKPNSEQDRRRSPRYVLHQLVSLGFAREKYIHAEAVDISTHGIGCVSDSPVDLYSRVFIMLQGEPTEENPPISCEGIAVRCEKLGKERYSLGIEFTDIFEFDLARIAKFSDPE